MNADEAAKIASVLETADGNCYVCAEALAKEMAKIFPEHDWLKLVRRAHGDTPEEPR